MRDDTCHIILLKLLCNFYSIFLSKSFKDVPLSKAFYSWLGFLILYTKHDVIPIHHLVIFILCIVVMCS